MPEIDPNLSEQERLVIREEAGEVPMAGDANRRGRGTAADMPDIDIKWRVQGDDPAAYLNLDASLGRFQQLAADALEREGIAVERVPITLIIDPFVDARRLVSDDTVRRAYDVVARVWAQGAWKVSDPAHGA